MGVEMTSIMFSFILAFAKTLVKKELVDKKELSDEFKKVRANIKPGESMTIGDKEIMSFLGIKEK